MMWNWLEMYRHELKWNEMCLDYFQCHIPLQEMAETSQCQRCYPSYETTLSSSAKLPSVTISDVSTFEVRAAGSNDSTKPTDAGQPLKQNFHQKDFLIVNDVFFLTSWITTGTKDQVLRGVQQTHPEIAQAWLACLCAWGDRLKGGIGWNIKQIKCFYTIDWAERWNRDTWQTLQSTSVEDEHESEACKLLMQEHPARKIL